MALLCLSKSLLFGALTAASSCLAGLAAEGDWPAVSQASGARGVVWPAGDFAADALFALLPALWAGHERADPHPAGWRRAGAARRPADAMRLEPGQSNGHQRRPAGRRPGDAGAAGKGGLLSTLSVADNLTLAASYHGMPWAELDAALALLPALALDAAAWCTLLAPPNNSAPTTAAGAAAARRSPQPPPG